MVQPAENSWNSFYLSLLTLINNSFCNYSAIISAFLCNVILEKPNQKCKVSLTKWVKQYLIYLCTYLHVLENVSTLSFQFQRNLYMAFENCTELKRICSKLEEMMDEIEEAVVDSFLKKLSRKFEFDWLTLIAGNPNPGHNCWLPKGKKLKIENL